MESVPLTELSIQEWLSLRLERWRLNRDTAALGELLRWHRNRAYAVALRLTGESADAEDAVQQAFLKLMTRTHGFDDLSDFKASVFRAIQQCALNLLVSKRIRSRREENMDHFPIASNTPSPQVEAERKETAAILTLELLALDEISRTTVVLCRPPR